MHGMLLCHFVIFRVPLVNLPIPSCAEEDCSLLPLWTRCHTAQVGIELATELRMDELELLVLLSLPPEYTPPCLAQEGLFCSTS